MLKNLQNLNTYIMMVHPKRVRHVPRVVGNNAVVYGPQGKGGPLAGYGGINGTRRRGRCRV